MAEKYNHREIEQKWRDLWDKLNVYATPQTPRKDKKKYILDAFAYPSGSGLHAGHAEGYSATDIAARYYRMAGYDVLYPVGWDAFGLPAENYAIKTGLHPRVNTDQAISTFVKQVKELGLSNDWNDEIASHRPDYYKWTQWFFSLLYKKGLAYKKEALVNWDPVDQTVLANEQVLPDGTAERSGAMVEQRMLSQWFFKITDYVEDKVVEDGPNQGKLRTGLLNGLEKVNWPESTKLMQRNWIGRSVGAIVRFVLDDEAKAISGTEAVDVFTTRIDTIFSGTYLILAPEHPLVEKLTTEEQFAEVQEYVEKTKQKTELQRTDLNKDKSGAFTGSYAINPANGFKMQIWISDFVLSNYGTGAVFADAHDERDFELAKKYDIPLATSIRPAEIKDDSAIRNLEECFSGYGILYNSAQFDGLASEEAKPKIIEWLAEKGYAEAKITYRLRDWLVSRQRYWGAPIPIVYKPKANADLDGGMTDGDWEAVLVEDSELPVVLPDDVEFHPTGRSPLYDHPGFHKSAQAKYGPGARRESDTMDTFVCSSWYFLRFCDPRNEFSFADKDKMNAWCPVDEYVIGAEHTVLHLLYARFFTKVLFDEGYIDFDEPFLSMRHPGMILGEDSRKMSKRWGNVINPSDVVEELGADTIRLYEMFMGPFDQSKAWNISTIKGVRRFLERVWKLQGRVYSLDDAVIADLGRREIAYGPSTERTIEVALNKLIKKVGQDIVDFSFNTAVAEYMKFVNLVEDTGAMTPSQWIRFLKALAPFAPFITDELYQIQSSKFKPQNESSTPSIHQQSWPTYDPAMTVDDEVVIGVQVNGKLRGEISVNDQDNEASVLEKALADSKIQAYTEGKVIRKFIYVPKKIVNIVVA